MKTITDKNLLIALLIGLGGLLYMAFSDRASPKLSTWLTSSEQYKLAYLRSHSSVLELQQDSRRQWQLKQPWQVAIRPQFMGQLSAFLQSPVQRTWQTQADLRQDFGLAETAIIWQTGLGEIRIGRQAAFENESCYIEYQQQIHLLSDCPSILREQQALAWVSRYPLGQQAQLRGLQHGQCVAAYTATGWRWLHDANLSVDSLQDWLQAWLYIQAYQVLTVYWHQHLSLQKQIEIQTLDQGVLYFSLWREQDSELDDWFLLNQSTGLVYYISATQINSLFPVEC